MCECVLCVCLYLNVIVLPNEAKESTGCLKLVLQAVVSHLRWVLRTRHVHALNH